MDRISLINDLPEKARDYFKSSDITLAVERALLTYQIPMDSVATISKIVGDLFLTKGNVLNLNEEIAQKASLPMEVAKGISLLLLERVFVPFPEIFSNLDEAKKNISVDAAEPKITDELAEKELHTIEPWLDKEVPSTVVERRIVDAVASPVVGNILQTVKLPLLKAMSDYKHIADQMITSEKIKLRNSMELVRPTLSNWIRSYREELGVGFHEPVQRANFLFQTQNGKKLNNGDRAKLNLILKSIEENFPLDIDPKREMIVFPAGSDASMELTQVSTNARPVANRFIQARAMPVGTVQPAAFAPGAAPSTPVHPQGFGTVKPTPATPVLANLKPLFSKSTPPEKNISGETLHFSTGHVLPAEKAAEKPPVTVQSAPTAASPETNTALRAQPHPTQGIRREPGSSLLKSPYTIRPLRLRGEADSTT